MCYPLTDDEIAAIAARATSHTEAIREALDLAGLRPSARKIPRPPPAPRMALEPGAVLTAVDPSEVSARSYAGPHTPAVEEG